MDNIVSVRLRDTGQNFVYNAHDLEVKEGTFVIMEHDRGLDYGQVVSLKGDSAKGALQPVKRIVRIARENDLKQIEENRLKSKEAFTTCQAKIAEHKLEMKLVQAEYSFDRSKIIFYFTSDGRVDFRNLVKDLAKIFKARIELRQIGVRDETKFFGGYGPCGRQLCCSTFLKDFEPVTIKMAKEEGLPLNPPKISGICGRLMCCLNYEYEAYKMLSKGLPREGERITTPEGKGKVLSVNVFKRIASVELEDGKFIQVVYKEKTEGGQEQIADKTQRPGCACEQKDCPGCPSMREDVPPHIPVQPPIQSPTQVSPPLIGSRRDAPSGAEASGRASVRPPIQKDGLGRASAQGKPSRNDRQERNRQERNNRPDYHNRKPWYQRTGQPRPGNDKPQGPSAPQK